MAKHKADPALAARLYHELVDTFDSFLEIAQFQGVETLADIVYLQGAILTGGWVDPSANAGSQIHSVLRALDSYEEFAVYLRPEVENVDQV